MRRRTGEEEEADTELKTKTPHINVGKKQLNEQFAALIFPICNPLEVAWTLEGAGRDLPVLRGAGAMPRRRTWDMCTRQLCLAFHPTKS